MKPCYLKVKILACSAFLLCLTKCDMDKKGKVGTDLIHIPATASSYSTSPKALPAIAFIDTLVDIGIVSEGTQADVIFNFFNTGTAPLILSDVSTSCGCTLAEKWPREPIESGGSGKVVVRFDSRGRIGDNRKEVYVVTNAVPATRILVLTAEVIGPSSKK
tara:strand:- start:542 stop:1024 length:483 start_codon:yes stop_codon:yes gene_type:complete